MPPSPPSAVSLAPVDLGVIGAYFLAVLWVGFRAARRQTGDSEDFLLAGRHLTLPMFVATLVATWYGGILGVGEFSYTYGLSQWTVFGFPYYVFAVIFALFLATRIQGPTAVTIPDRLRSAYGPTAGYMGAVFTFLMINPAPYMLMVGVLLQLIFGGSLLVALVVGTLLSCLYLIAGGFRSVTATNYLEFAFMYGGFACILPFAWAEYGGLEFLSTHLPPLHLTWHGGNTTQAILAWFFIALWTLIDPGFHQRCEAARSGGVAKWGILVSVGFWFLFDAMTVTAGLYARAALPGLEQPSLAYPALATQVLPPVIRGIFFTGMLATIMSTLVSYSFLAGQTLGRDLIWRMRGGSDVAATRIGLVLALAVAGLLVWMLPSVVQLWYAVGSAMVPGMLLPLLLTWANARPRPWNALAMMVSGSGISTTWLILGHLHAVEGAAVYPWGIEPLYPGLLATGILWGIGAGFSRCVAHTQAGSEPPTQIG